MVAKPVLWLGVDSAAALLLLLQFMGEKGLKIGSRGCIMSSTQDLKESKSRLTLSRNYITCCASPGAAAAQSGSEWEAWTLRPADKSRPVTARRCRAPEVSAGHVKQASTETASDTVMERLLPAAGGFSPAQLQRRQDPVCSAAFKTWFLADLLWVERRRSACAPLTISPAVETLNSRQSRKHHKLRLRGYLWPMEELQEQRGRDETRTDRSENEHPPGRWWFSIYSGPSEANQHGNVW